MPGQLFYVLWGIFALVALGILAWAGNATGKGLTGALIDKRNRYSLNRFQLIMWTVIIIPALMALFFSGGLKIPDISPELLGLIGISAGSAATAGAVKSSKNVQAEAAKQRVARLNAVASRATSGSPEAIAVIRAASQPEVPKVAKSAEPRPAQVILEEEGSQADDVVSVTKFQNFLLTLVAGVALVVMIVEQGKLDLELSDQFLWLLGISHAAYVGGKVPHKP